MDTSSNVFIINQQYRKKEKPVELLAKRTKYFEASLARLLKRLANAMRRDNKTIMFF